MPPTFATLDPIITFAFFEPSWPRCLPVEFYLWALEREVLILILPADVAGMLWNACFEVFEP